MRRIEVPKDRIVGDKVDLVTKSFMEFCEDLGITFVDCTPVKSSKKNVRETKSRTN